MNWLLPAAIVVAAVIVQHGLIRVAQQIYYFRLESEARDRVPR